MNGRAEGCVRLPGASPARALFGAVPSPVTSARVGMRGGGDGVALERVFRDSLPVK